MIVLVSRKEAWLKSSKVELGSVVVIPRDGGLVMSCALMQVRLARCTRYSDGII